MLLETVVVGSLDTNCYIFGDYNGEAIVIDPGADEHIIIQHIKRFNCNLKYIVLTHGHFDHIGAVGELKNKTGAKVLIHLLDSGCLTDASQNLSIYVGKPKIQVPADIMLKNGDIIEVGQQKLSVIHTPGHTRGSICLSGDRILFSGDTLFRESAGRTDLPGGSGKEIMNSIKKLMELDSSTVVYPGHSKSSTIGHERTNNPFVKAV